MSTINKYVIKQVDCEKTGCEKMFKVIISPIYTVVTSPVKEINIQALQKNTIANDGLINNYIVAKCHCGHFQRVYLKINKDE